MQMYAKFFKLYRLMSFFYASVLCSPLHVGAPAVEQGYHVGREFGGEEHLFARARMYEAEGTGMQCLARTGVEAVGYKLAVRARCGALEYLVASVALVIEERVPEVLHVYAYLVRATRLEDTLHEGDIADALQHLIVRHGMLAYGGVGEDGHL